MNLKHMIWGFFLCGILLSSFITEAISKDFSNEIKTADTKVIYEKYAEAEELYKNIVKSSDSPTILAYVHYKLGMLQMKKRDRVKARQEYEAGLNILEHSGQKNHPIGRFLSQALQLTGK